MSLTIEQFNKLVTKDEFNREIGELKNGVKEIKKGVGELLTAVDGLAKKVDNLDSEFVVNLAAHDRFETRITKLEKSPRPLPAYRTGE